jgi:hypothetical protein
MSGSVKNNVFGSSGVVLAAAGGLSWQDVVTASTVTVEAGKGYWINTTSNACTITLPSSPAVGDQVILGDYARTWDTNAITIDSNGNNFQGDPDTYTVDYDTEGQTINLVYADSTKGWIPTNDIANALTALAPNTTKGIFAYGVQDSSKVSMSNLVNINGVVASDVTGVGTARLGVRGVGYGGDKGIFAFGNPAASGDTAVSNLVSNTGVIASDTTGVGSTRDKLAATTFGVGRAIFAYGQDYPNAVSVSNIVSDQGVVASDVSGVGSIRQDLAAVSYSTDKGIFAYGNEPHTGSGGLYSLSNKVGNNGVIASDVTGVGTARSELSAASYGVGKGAFGYGNTGSVVSLKNLVSDSGVIAADVTGVGTARRGTGACGYGIDKGIFAYGYEDLSISNLMSNTGVIAADVTGVGSGRSDLGALGFSLSG